MKITDISVEVLNDLFLCDAENGRLFWKHRPQKYFDTLRGFMVWNARYAGKEAFTYAGGQGYKQGRIFSIGVTAHRIIWAMSYGSWANEIDHINGIRTDNRLANLRSVTRGENTKNSSISAANRTGVAGVSHCKQTNSWRVSLAINGKATNLGRYKNFNDAVKVRKAAEKEYGYHINHGKLRNLQSSFSNP